MESKVTESVRSDNTAAGEFRPCNKGSVTILDVLGVDLARSERVSRRWQRVVCDYLQTCALSYYHSMLNIYCKNDLNHRDIVMPYTYYANRQLIQLIRKTLKKWGSCIVKVMIDIDCYEYIDIIANTCPYLQYIQFNIESCWQLKGCSTHNINCKKLKHLSLQTFPRKFNDDSFVKLFKNLDCEKLEMSHNNGMSGSFLNSYKLNNLKSLTLVQCFALNPELLCSNAHKLRNLKTLILNNIGENILKKLHILLQSTPKLEDLSLCNYGPTVLSDEVIASFSQLDLKRVNLVRNASVSSALLEALAQGSSRLERVDVTGVREACGRGVAALCRRPLVTLLLGYIYKDTTDFNQCRHDFKTHTGRIPVIGELEALGCVEFTKQWWEDTWHAFQGRDHPLELTLCHTRVESQRELNIILADNFIDQRPMMF